MNESLSLQKKYLAYHLILRLRYSKPLKWDVNGIQPLNQILQPQSWPYTAFLLSIPQRGHRWQIKRDQPYPRPPLSYGGSRTAALVYTSTTSLPDRYLAISKSCMVISRKFHDTLTYSIGWRSRILDVIFIMGALHFPL